MDGLNLLIDPICRSAAAPVPFFGPKRRQAPGLRFADLPPIDAVLVTHNHYDLLDLPTLKALAAKGVRQAVHPFWQRGADPRHRDRRGGGGDWWQQVSLSPR